MMDRMRLPFDWIAVKVFGYQVTVRQQVPLLGFRGILTRRNLERLNFLLSVTTLADRLISGFPQAAILARVLNDRRFFFHCVDYLSPPLAIQICSPDIPWILIAPGLLQGVGIFGSGQPRLPAALRSLESVRNGLPHLSVWRFYR
jgi:hypothetical protein